MDRVAKAIWEANSEHKQFELPPFEKLWPTEQEEWREAARAAIAVIVPGASEKLHQQLAKLDKFEKESVETNLMVGK